MTSQLTVGRVIDIARARHPAFTNVVADGLLVSAMDARQRSLILQYGASVAGMISTSTRIAARVSGSLIGVNENGSPYYLTTLDDGYPVHVNGNGSLYIDTTDTAIAQDPFGENGGTPGFPLPPDYVKLIAVSLVFQDRTLREVDVIREEDRFAPASRSKPTVFLSGNRLVPRREMESGNSGDVWSLPIEAINVSYVGFPVLETMTDPVTLPAALSEALIAFVATQFAYGDGVPPAVRARFEAEELRITEDIGQTQVKVAGSVQRKGVQLRR